MTTIIIPKELTKNQKLIAVPHNLYGEFLNWQRKIKSVKTFKPTASEKKTLAKARKNFSQGKCMTFKQLKNGLGIDN
ncbi:MAG: hypothetical protein Q7R65_00765 [bacterium]|nr:hypothetical protein [bacterium]